jgi:hypothetical protein
MMGARQPTSIGEKLIDLAFRADARSIRQYEELKSRIAYDLVALANGTVNDPIVVRDQRPARERSNRQAVALEVAVKDLPAWYRWWLQWCGEKPRDASKNLIRLGNATGPEHAEKSIEDIKRWLRL